MKQIKLIGILATALMLGLAGCSGTPGGDSTNSNNSTTSVHVHSWGNPSVTKQPTCTEPGEQVQECECGETNVTPIPAKGHTWGEEYDRHEATVDEAGSYKHKCTVCQFEEEVTIPKLQAEMTLSEIHLAKEENKVALVAKGTAKNFKTFEVAWGLYHIDLSSGNGGMGGGGWSGGDFDWGQMQMAVNLNEVQEGGEGVGQGADGDEPVAVDNFMYGHETPEDADYQVVTLGENGAFEAKLILSDIQVKDGFEKAGLFNIYFGAKGLSFSRVELEADERITDSSFRYYFRNDNQTNSALAVAIEDLPPFQFTEVDIYQKDEVDANGFKQVWVKIGGEAKGGLTQEQLNAFTPFIQFQTIPGNSYERISTRTSSDKDRYYFELAGNKAYIHINISFMVVDEVYNTHLNIQELKQQDCVLDVSEAINKEVKFADDYRIFTIWFNGAGGHVEDNIWGNLGFKTASNPDVPAPSTGGEGE